MDVMDRPRTRHADHDPDLTEQAQAEAERTFWSIEDEKLRVEIIAGQVIVSPSPTPWHADTVYSLGYAFAPIRSRNDWKIYPDTDTLLAKTKEIFRPDLVVVRDLEKFSQTGKGIPGECVVLTAEIVSPSGVTTDRETKRISYARNGIPFYLLIDRFTDPATATLYSQPTDRDYTAFETVPTGPGGGKLHIPEPVDLTVDLSALPGTAA
jgi:Uma2 family endonuclease